MAKRNCPECNSLVEGKLWFSCKCGITFTLPMEELKKVIDERTGKYIGK